MQSPNTLKKGSFAAAALLALAGCGGDAPAARVGAAQATPVTTTTVTPVKWRDTIEALGTARANESVTLTAKVSEIVRKVGFESGDLVEHGRVLVDLSSGVQLAELEEARAAYQEAERQLKRQQELAARQLISASAIDAQRAARDAAKARMDVVRAQLSDRVITAPFDGVLGLRQVSPGSLVTPGTPIATLDDVSIIKLDFSVPERFLAVLRRGQDITAQSTTYPGREFSGKVESVDSRVDPVTRSITVRAQIPNPDRQLRPGMLMSVLLYQNPHETLVVPEIAVLQVGMESFVYRVTKEATVERVRIELGSRRKGEVEVAEGLAAGDRIVVEGTVKLRDGTRVVEALPAADGAKPQAMNGATAGSS
ncbi:MAG: efflux RND transporter periplasmic adaptor subunit [Steroidobacteraceae bacterium]